eukprot:CAMPEP_0115305348 /NCGR_PEP_ID=MMETSP0270-20121206/71975_1 /TAXON_ID=71861 /ORGANISM="Scrippsiella trochoidea, Strain CCMP3099" /LENGTH=269 /DNA_ID=CAMNT_0002723549 /DNA_START=89 /DNA_END=894 /DNA_ORIENTATION=+
MAAKQEILQTGLSAASLSQQESELQRFEMSEELDSEMDDYRSSWSPHAFLKQIVGHKVFEFVVIAVICCNVVTIGLQADWSVKSTGDATIPRIYSHFDLAYAVFFTVEWLLRVSVEGMAFFLWAKPSWTKNMFDTFIVFSSIVEESVKFVLGDVPNMSSMRVIRVFRLIRIARIIRLARAFHDLRVMLNGIMISMKSLLSASLLLIIMGFIFGVAVLEFVSVELHGIAQKPEEYENSDEHEAQLRGDWGGVLLAVFTLYKAISGGVDWG